MVAVAAAAAESDDSSRNEVAAGKASSSVAETERPLAPVLFWPSPQIFFTCERKREKEMKTMKKRQNSN